MLREIETRSAGYETVCQDLMEILIVLFGRQTNFSTILSPANKRASHLCDSVRRYIDQNCGDELSLEHLAKFSHVNKYYLVHAFTDEYGISPINYLMHARVKKLKSCWQPQITLFLSSAIPVVFLLQLFFPDL